MMNTNHKFQGKDAKQTSLEVERKYKVHLKQDQFNIDFEELEIFQTYLISENFTTEERVRKISLLNKILYYHTTKKPVSDTERIENEELISESAYEDYLKKKDPERNTIHKKRKTFLYKNQNFELDTYIQPALPYQILELEGVNEHAAINFPPFIKIIEDVTGNKAYSNFELAKV